MSCEVPSVCVNPQVNLLIFKGEKGDQGPQGVHGEPGPSGGEKGDPGDSAYQVWLSSGHTGTEEDFFNYIKGPKGDTGATGAVGGPGAKGDKGDKGDTGATGTTGTQGLSAYQVWLSLGNTGTEEDFILAITGPAGGPPGPQGETGATGPQGPVGPASGAIYTALADVTVTNTTSEQTLISASAIGSNIVAANTLIVGQSYQITIVGKISTGASNTDSTIKIKLDGTTLVATLGTIPTNLTDAYFELSFVFTVRGTGVAGTAIGQGRTLISPSSGIGNANIRRLAMTAITAINTTQANAIDVTCQWATASTSNSITATNAYIKQIA